MSEYRQHSYQAPAGATEILLVRHGESRAASEDNPFPLVDGHGDPELHANGEQQAILVGERLRQESISAIYVSNLQRTHQTAAPLSKRSRLPPLGPQPCTAPSRKEGVHRSQERWPEQIRKA